jgi:PAS domain S-box-containing protein
MAESLLSNSLVKAPQSANKRLRDVAGYLLAGAYLAIVCLGFWLRHDFAEANAQAAAELDRWSTHVRNAEAVTRSLAGLYTAALDGTASSEVRKTNLDSARQALTDDLGRLSNDIGYEKTSERPTLTSLFRKLENGVAAFEAELAKPLPDRAGAVRPGMNLRSARAVNDAYHNATVIDGRLRDYVRNVAHQRAQEQAATMRRFHRLDYAVHALLLFTVGCTTFFLYRLARQVRSDVREKAALLARLRETDVKFRSIFDNATEGMFQASLDGRLLIANKALARMYGYESPERLIEAFGDGGTQVYFDAAQRQHLLESLGATGALSNFVFEVIRPDRRMMWLRENVHAVRGESGEFAYIEGTVEDISDRWWGEQRRKLQYSTTRILTESATVAEARPRILETICETLEWDMGAVWDVTADQELLECVEIWHKAQIDIAEFDEANSTTTYTRGTGLAGEVWKIGRPKWIANLADADFPNAAIAAKAGMGSAFGVPIMVQGEVRHVLEFFSPKVALPDPELLHTLELIGAQLGQLIERKGAEEALRKSEMRKAGILRNALDCVISFDLDGKITEFNPAAERAFGYRATDVLGEDLVQLIIPETLRESQRRGFRLYNNGTISGPAARRMELTAMRSDGSEFPAELGISRIVIDDKVMFTAFLRDITERKLAERTTSELAAVVENSTDAIVSCTLTGTILSWNVGAERIYGYTAEEAIGERLHMLIPPERLDEFSQTLTAVKRGESLADYETVRLRKDQRKISVSLTESPIRAGGDRITGLSSIARDITERKRLEQELLQSQKMEAVGRLAGGIAHDFNNILTAILGYSDLVISQITERQWMFKHLAEIRKAAEFAASLTHQLLAFSRRQPLFLRVFHINDTVRNMEKMLQRVIGEHIKIVTIDDAEIGRVKADPTQIEQVLLNLCVNARDAMDKGGTIEIHTEDVTCGLDDPELIADMPAGEYVKLSVSDTGVGIAPEVVKHIFEPFFTTKDKEQGTGLGLATCYGIIKQSGGYIGVESVVGRGTKFSIYLPRVEASGEKSVNRKDQGELPGGNETILYVEDEVTVRRLTAQVLRRLGYTVLEANDGREARSLVELQDANAIDLLFSDVVLPDSDGKQLCDWLRERSPGAKVLFCSGYVDDEILRRHGLEYGVPFLQKPFTAGDVARKVREVVDTIDVGTDAVI